MKTLIQELLSRTAPGKRKLKREELIVATTEQLLSRRRMTSGKRGRS